MQLSAGINARNFARLNVCKYLVVRGDVPHQIDDLCAIRTIAVAGSVPAVILRYSCSLVWALRVRRPFKRVTNFSNLLEQQTAFRAQLAILHSDS